MTNSDWIWYIGVPLLIFFVGMPITLAIALAIKDACKDKKSKPNETKPEED